MEPQWARDYLDHLKATGMNKGTWGYHLYHLRFFLQWLGIKRVCLEQMTTEGVCEYLRFRKALGHTHGNQKSALSALRDLVGYLGRRGMLRGDPTQGVCCSWLDVPGGYAAYQGALRQIVHAPYVMVKYRLPLFAPYWERYLRHLLDHGYARRHLLHVLNHHFHFHRYLVRKRVKSLERVTPELVDSFLRQGRIASQRNRGRPLARTYVSKARSYIENFLAYVWRGRGRSFRRVTPPPRSQSITEGLLKRYVEFAGAHLGLRPRTRQLHLYWLEKLGAFLDRRGIPDVRQVKLVDLDDFLIEGAPRMRAHTIQRIAGSLRSFFRYLHLRGKLPADLARDIASPVRFSADQWPKFLPWTKIEELLKSVERDSVVGKRDYAILALMACHGLRNREVGYLRISDIDWEDRCALLRERKNGSTTRLPLSEMALQALREYLAVRPSRPDPELFLTQRAPIKPLGAAAHAVVQRHLRRCFAGSLPHYGAYVLRHSFAKVMLDRGAKLPDIAELLGHRRLDSTFIYTRVATEDMREVADNYAKFLVNGKVPAP